ncbi:MAG: hypothetical protein AAGF11_30005 [Myxococcota bacterium]
MSTTIIHFALPGCMGRAHALVLGAAVLATGCPSSDDEPSGATDANASAETTGDPGGDPTTGEGTMTPESTGAAESEDSSGGPGDDTTGAPADSSTGDPVGPAPGCPDIEAAMFCDDFESYSVGDAPAGPWTPEGMGSAQIDDSQVFSGSQAVRLDTMAGYNGRALLGLDEESVFPTTHFFGRVRLYVTEASPDGINWTMIQASGMTEAPEVWDGPFAAELRYGGQNMKQLKAGYETGGFYAVPPEGPGSDCWQHSQTAIAEGQWSCMEWEFDTDNDVMRMWVDGVAVEGLEVGTMGQGCVHPDTNDVWYYPDTFERMHVGWVDYQDTAGEREVWIDDVAIGSSRIGCD